MVANAERQGFEPWEPCGSHALQACALDHSATSPKLKSIKTNYYIHLLTTCTPLATALIRLFNARLSAVDFSVVRKNQRRVEDLNLRSPYDDNGFRDRRIQPLCQLSKTNKSSWRTQRWGRDSNSGWTYAHNGFQDRRIRPLCHPTKFKTEKAV